MTLFYDGSESRRGTQLPQDVIEYGFTWNSIERVTGGDLVVTPGLSVEHKVAVMKEKLTAAQIASRLDLSIAEVVRMQREIDDLDSVLFGYLYRGAVVIQRKSGQDLIASVQGPRLEESLARMDRTIPHRAQRLLLYTGVFSEKDGYVVLDGAQTHLKYMAWVMALTAWCNRGGTVVNLASDALMLRWIQLLEEQLESYRHASDKYVYPETYYPPDMPDRDDLLQMPIEVADWRKTMVTFPNLGPDRVNALKKNLEDNFGHATLWNALQCATSQSALDIHGWGPKSIKSVRRWLDIPDGYELVLQPNGEDTNV